jgi:hypothetical protein
MNYSILIHTNSYRFIHFITNIMTRAGETIEEWRLEKSPQLLGGQRVISKCANGQSNWYSGDIVSVNRTDMVCEIKWDDGGKNRFVEFKWIRISIDDTTSSHKDVGKNNKHHVGVEWDGGEHRFANLETVINSYDPPLNVIEMN